RNSPYGSGAASFLSCWLTGLFRLRAFSLIASRMSRCTFASYLLNSLTALFPVKTTFFSPFKFHLTFSFAIIYSPFGFFFALFFLYICIIHRGFTFVKYLEGNFLCCFSIGRAGLHA